MTEESRIENRDSRRGERGQAMTEMVLLFPVFLFFMFGFVKVFSLLILVQKVEIAAVYAASRWEFESHRNVLYAAFDSGPLTNDIKNKVMRYIGFKNRKLADFLDLDRCTLNIDREAIWSTVTLTVTTTPWGRKFKFLEDQSGPIRKSSGLTFSKVKYVPSRDRPISYVLPGGD
jgi:Flp pilus assembly protein TadG